MAIKLRRKLSRRTFQCDVAGCRHRTAYLISKRDDVAAHPLHLCDDCIRGLYALLTGEDAGPEVPTLAPDGGVAINGGAEAVAAIPDEADTMDWGEEPKPKKAEEPEPKKADEPKLYKSRKKAT